MNVIESSERTIFCHSEVHYSRVLFLTEPLLHGEDVRMLQKSLGFRGYLLPQDGIFGPCTSSVLRMFQYSKGLKPDGIFGIKTRAKICR